MAQIELSSITDLIRQIDSVRMGEHIVTIGVAGLGGSGKTTLCKAMIEHYNGFSFHFACDLFAKYDTCERRSRIEAALANKNKTHIEAEENPRNWYDWQGIESAIEALKNTGSFKINKGWNQKTGKKDKSYIFQIPSHEHVLIFVDCIYLLHSPVCDWLDKTVFVDTPLEITFERGRIRDQHRSDPSYLAYKQELAIKYDVPYFKKHAKNADWIMRTFN